MTDPDDTDPLVREVRRRRDRRNRAEAEGEMPIGRRLAQIGVLGWIIVAPTLLGLFLGRWMDGHFGSGLFWTAPLMLAGLCLGGWSAWKWMNDR
jgi:ATP synthase protein I